ncbi:MAG TPA: hypothetical protein VEH81_08810, partial [Ktedonobacteraceae bacterium]|nr:hypothetical protein [Ktedonobacteraceae bacterium]
GALCVLPQWATIGYQVEEFLSKAIQQHADRLLAKMHKAWMPLVQWDALVRGDQYPLCSEIASQLPLNPNSNICLLSAQAYEERVNLLRAAL